MPEYTDESVTELRWAAKAVVESQSGKLWSIARPPWNEKESAIVACVKKSCLKRLKEAVDGLKKVQ